MEKKSAEAIDIIYLLSAMLFWMLCSIIFLPVAALGAHIFEFGENALAYMSSALSFVTAAFAGGRAIYLRKKNAVGTALVTAACIIILALTLGFIIAGERLEAAGILSLVSFTLSGCMVGAVFFPGKKNTKRKTRLNVSKGR